jgi:hypothetical protein
MLVNAPSVKQTSFMNSWLPCRFLATGAFLWLALAADAADVKPTLLYSRYFNAVGETRYLPDGDYRELLQRLGKDFEVRTHAQPLNAATLAEVNVVLIANPSDEAVGNNPPPHHVSAPDIEALTRFVQNGGALILMGNQENHNLEIHDMNVLLKRFGLQFTNRYTDAKLLPLPKETPIIGGLNWGYYTGNLVAIDANHAARSRALVTNDLSIKPPKGNRDQAGALLAIAEPGRGRVIVVTDAGWVADWALDDRGVGGLALKGQDNFEVFRRLLLWAARRE